MLAYFIVIVDRHLTVRVLTQMPQTQRLVCRSTSPCGEDKVLLGRRTNYEDIFNFQMVRGAVRS